MTSTIEGDTMTIRLDAAGDVDFSGSRGASFGNNLQVTGSVEDPDGNLVNVTLEQVGPGVYEARLPARQSGNYIVDLNMRSPDGEARRVIGGSSKAAGGELRNFQSNTALLQQIAEMTGGRVLDPGNPVDANLYNRDVPIESMSTRPLRWQLMPFLLALLLLDVACRRIAWEGQEVAAWAKGRANAIAGITRTRKVEGASTMAALKAKREETSEKLNQPAEPSSLAGLAAKVKGTTNGQSTEKPKTKPRSARHASSLPAMPTLPPPPKTSAKPSAGKRRQGRQAHRHRCNARARNHRIKAPLHQDCSMPSVGLNSV